MATHWTLGGDAAVMRAVVIEEYGVLPEVREVPRPETADGSVVLKVEATG